MKMGEINLGEQHVPTATGCAHEEDEGNNQEGTMNPMRMGCTREENLGRDNSNMQMKPCINAQAIVYSVCNSIMTSVHDQQINNVPPSIYMSYIPNDASRALHS